MRHYRIAQKSVDSMPLLQVGDTIVTPDGSGVIVNVALQLANYHGNVEIDPPVIRVQLDNGTVDNYCLCQMDFGDEEINDLVASEFQRLWPPMDEAVPEAADVVEAR